MSTDQFTADTQIDDFEDEFFDSFAFGGKGEYRLPGKRTQTITFAILNEGQKAKYERATNRDVRVDRKNDQALLKIDQAADRHALIMAAVTDWSLLSRNPRTQEIESMAFSETNLKNWLQVTSPRIVTELAEAIQKLNPWLNTDDVTIEDIDGQIEDLQKLRAEKVREEEGKA